MRNRLDYWIDGMVLRVDNNDLYEQLGVVGKTPRGLVAWKFPAEEVTTIVEDVEWMVGRTGVVTPVAVLKPTQVGGTTVKHASLHNADEVRRLDIRIGDTVILYKAGDVIPKVKKVLKELRPKGAKPVHAPKNCPVCHQPLSKKEGEVAIVCTNRNCPARDRERIIHAVRAFDIEGFGPATATALLDKGIIQTPADLFALEPEDFLELEGFAEVSAKKIVDAIQAKKNIPLHLFITGLGIKHVGGENAILLAERFGSIEKLAKATKEDLMDIPGIGEVVAESVIDFFSQKYNQELINTYKKNGVRIKPPPKKGPQLLKGKTFVVTGTLEQYSRDEIKDEIRRYGGEVSSSVSAKTDFVLVGENPGSKAKKAEELGVRILSEKEFLRMIGK